MKLNVTPLAHRARLSEAAVEPEVLRVLTWYFKQAYGGLEGPERAPFYCDPARVGYFAVSPIGLADQDDGAVFRLFMTLSMYQALRDKVIRHQQRSLARASVRIVADEAFIRRSISKHACPALFSAETLDRDCDVRKGGGVVDCERYPGLRCHVKDATVVFNRMGDMGKLPSSAWLRFWKDGGLRRAVTDVSREEHSPTRRAELLVNRFASVHRVGRKLATMFVSALSTPALAPGLTPWFPAVDGNELVVVDTNVARAVDTLRPVGTSRTYDSRVAWIRHQAARIDLRDFHPDLPVYSPRLVQQALYTFCSRSNRAACDDPCAGLEAPCTACAPALCPFATKFPHLRKSEVGCRPARRSTCQVTPAFWTRDAAQSRDSRATGYQRAETSKGRTRVSKRSPT